MKKQGHLCRSIVREYGATNSKLNDVYTKVLTSTKPHEERSEPFSFFKPEHEKVKTMLKPDFMFAFGTKPLTKPQKPDFMFESGTKLITKPETPISDFCWPRREMDRKIAGGCPIRDVSFFNELENNKLCLASIMVIKDFP